MRSPRDDTKVQRVAGSALPGLTLEEWNEKAREQGIGANRPATLTDAHRDLKNLKLVHECNGRWFVTTPQTGKDET